MYIPNSIYGIICGLQKSSDQADINISPDSMFAKFRQVLDMQMKQLKSTGNFEKVSATTNIWKPKNDIINFHVNKII